MFFPQLVVGVSPNFPSPELQKVAQDKIRQTEGAREKRENIVEGCGSREKDSGKGGGKLSFHFDNYRNDFFVVNGGSFRGMSVVRSPKHRCTEYICNCQLVALPADISACRIALCVTF